ncbi:hypothetical protein QCN29_34060 [Streptomyces sp. HNM0663]|uniref:Uncharacterized protein n=1 Tax=Streptomyces chengmaiensis TaxID=3040919 RepID=A0ABT6HYA5_9ACTN|nr:hypothetical protein [Streptomyces chengmaiensis]MDH2393701.1 hypothetical protein [Streptomyces chengmaiensis]
MPAPSSEGTDGCQAEPLRRLRDVMLCDAVDGEGVPDTGGALADALGDPADRLTDRIGIQDSGGQPSAGSVQRFLRRIVFPLRCFQRVLAHTPHFACPVAPGTGITADPGQCLYWFRAQSGPVG